MSKEQSTEKETMKTTTCGEPCEVYSRCCGYFRPVSNWNKGKQEEFKERRTFNVKPACNCSGN